MRLPAAPGRQAPPIQRSPGSVAGLEAELGRLAVRRASRFVYRVHARRPSRDLRRQSMPAVTGPSCAPPPRASGRRRRRGAARAGAAAAPASSAGSAPPGGSASSAAPALVPVEAAGAGARPAGTRPPASRRSGRSPRTAPRPPPAPRRRSSRGRWRSSAPGTRTAATARSPSPSSASGTDQRCARPGKGPEPGSTAGKSMIPRASTAATSAGVDRGRAPLHQPRPLPPAHEPPRRHRVAEGVDVDQRVAGGVELHRAARRSPWQITQVPVETTANGGRRARRCGRSEALESWMPQWTGVAGSRPVAAATSAVTGPRMSAARRSGGISAAQPMRSTSDENRRRAGPRGRCGSRARCARTRSTPVSRKRPVLRIHQDGACRARRLREASGTARRAAPRASAPPAAAASRSRRRPGAAAS